MNRSFARALLTASTLLVACESITQRTGVDAARDTGAVIDASQAEDVPDVVIADVSAPPDLPGDDAPDVSPGDVSDVIDADRVDATVEDAPDVVTADVHDASFVDTPDVVSTDAPDLVSTDALDVMSTDAPDVVTADTPDVVVNPFPSTGEDGPFPGTRVPNDAGVIELEPRVWNFTSVRVPQGLRVNVAQGSATLEVRATEAIVIEGTIDLSGGAGGLGAPNNPGSYALGGDTGIPHGPRQAVAQIGSYQASQGGRGTAGGNGTCHRVSSALGGAFGGGSAGGTCAGTFTASAFSAGGGGGGYAGGGGGFRYIGYDDGAGDGASHLSDQGGLGARRLSESEGGEARLLGTPLAIYAGHGGTTSTPWGDRGAGGGSIGRSAARDLALASTFRPGSGGGGGGSMCEDGCRRLSSGGGGGGGGGAIRLASPVSITVTRVGAILANGGRGGTGQVNGGGGSGGVIYLAAPEIALYGVLSVAPGPGAASSHQSGSGGLGRIRLSVDPVRCEATGTSNPPIPTGCAPSPDGGVPGQAYVGVWPN